MSILSVLLNGVKRERGTSQGGCTEDLEDYEEGEEHFIGAFVGI
jgi:hypothetical protein